MFFYIIIINEVSMENKLARVVHAFPKVNFKDEGTTTVAIADLLEGIINDQVIKYLEVEDAILVKTFPISGNGYEEYEKDNILIGLEIIEKH